MSFISDNILIDPRFIVSLGAGGCNTSVFVCNDNSKVIICHDNTVESVYSVQGRFVTYDLSGVKDMIYEHKGLDIHKSLINAYNTLEFNKPIHIGVMEF